MWSLYYFVETVSGLDMLPLVFFTPSLSGQSHGPAGFTAAEGALDMPIRYDILEK